MWDKPCYTFLAFVVIVAMAAPKDELAKEMTHDLEMHFNTIPIVTIIVISVIIGCCIGGCCACLWMRKTPKWLLWMLRQVLQDWQVFAETVFVYKTGKCYHCADCLKTGTKTSARTSTTASQVTRAQAAATSKRPCPCAKCELVWKAWNDAQKLSQ